MFAKLTTSGLIFGLFAYGVNTPPNDKNGTYAILAGIALLVAIVLVKKVIVPAMVNAQRRVVTYFDLSFMDSFACIAPDIKAVYQPKARKPRKAVKVNQAVKPNLKESSVYEHWYS